MTSFVCYPGYAKFLSRWKEKHLLLVTHLRLLQSVSHPQGRHHQHQRPRTVDHLQVAWGINQVHPVVMNVTLQLDLRKHRQGQVCQKKKALGHPNEGITMSNTNPTSELGAGGPRPGLEARPSPWKTIHHHDSFLYSLFSSTQALFRKNSIIFS